jgi:hypothetical protein
LSDLDLRTNAGKFANSIKEGLEAQIGNPTAGQQILIKLVAVKVLRCEMMARIENYFLAWSNSIRRDLEALGVLDTPSGNAGLFGIHPADMSDEQLDAAIALIQRRQPVCSEAEVMWTDDTDAAELELHNAEIDVNRR